jgi:hypothetical protein
VLPPRPDPCADDTDMGTLFGTDVPLATELGSKVDDCEAVFVTGLAPRLELWPDGSTGGMVVGTEVPLAIEPDTDGGDSEALFVVNLPEVIDVSPCVKD